MRVGRVLAVAVMAAFLVGCDTIQEAGYFTPVKQADGTTTGVFTTGAPAAAPSAPAPQAAVTAATLKSFDVYGATISLESNGEWASYDQSGNLVQLYREERREGDVVHFALPGVTTRIEVDLGKSQVRTINGTYTDTVVLLATRDVSAPRFVMDGVNGANVAKVSLEPAGYSRLVLGADKTWTQLNDKAQATGTHRETGRDDWSVYLTNDKGDQMQIDVHRKVFRLGPAGRPMDNEWKLLDVARLSPAAASAPAPTLTGKTVKKFKLASGSEFTRNPEGDMFYRVDGSNPAQRFYVDREGLETVQLHDDRGRMYGVDVVRKVFIEERQAPLPIVSLSR